jgi:hypothetical protein
MVNERDSRNLRINASMWGISNALAISALRVEDGMAGKAVSKHRASTETHAVPGCKLPADNVRSMSGEHDGSTVLQ